MNKLSIWERYTEEQRKDYMRYLQIYGALTNLFTQKKGDLIPYLDSKYQETIYSRSFKSKIVDIGNTPHDVLSVFGDQRIGIGIKTWMSTKDSYQKVMQLKKLNPTIDVVRKSEEPLKVAKFISEIRNDRMKQDYVRLGLSEDSNIYHYITRDGGEFKIQESTYPLIDISNIKITGINPSSLLWSDGLKEYKYTYSDSQIHQKFSVNSSDTIFLDKVPIEILDDPFMFLLNAFEEYGRQLEKETVEYEVAYLPLYSYSTKEVQEKSALNAWRAKSKSKGSGIPRPDREIYIPVPMEFHKKCPNFFTDNVLDLIERRKQITNSNKSLPKEERVEVPSVRFTLTLPNGNQIPGILTQDLLKGLQSGGYLPGDSKVYGQSELGNWLLNEVLKLEPGQQVTKGWLRSKGTDSIKIWRLKDNKENFYIDFAPIGSFEYFMDDRNPDELIEE